MLSKGQTYNHSFSLSLNVLPTHVHSTYVAAAAAAAQEAGAHGRDVWGIFRVHQARKSQFHLRACSILLRLNLFHVALLLDVDLV